MGVTGVGRGGSCHGQSQKSPGMTLMRDRCVPQGLLSTYCVPLAFMNPFHTQGTQTWRKDSLLEVS